MSERGFGTEGENRGERYEKRKGEEKHSAMWRCRNGMI